MDNHLRLALIASRNKRYGKVQFCPYCGEKWWHEDEDYIYSIDTYIKKLQCPYCEKLFEIQPRICR